MDIETLKQSIENNSISNNLLVFVLEDESSRVVADQYISIIASNKHLIPKVLSELDVEHFKSLKTSNKHDELNHKLLAMIPDDSFIEDDHLYIIETDKWTTNEQHINCIVLCKSGVGIKIPKLEQWQVIDFALSKATGLTREDIVNFIERYTDYNLFLNDIDKISLFPASQQRLLFNELLDQNAFDYARAETVFNLSDALLNRDSASIQNILGAIKYADITPLHLLSILYKQFRNILMVKNNLNASYTELGLKSEKQLWYLRKYKCNYYTNSELRSILIMLTGLEETEFFKGLDINQMIDYMVCNILGVK